MRKFSPLILAVLISALMGIVPVRAEPLPVNQRPMYGGVEKTPAMNQADAAFIAEVLGKGYTREAGSDLSVKNGWEYFFKGDLAHAMARFNQAWLLDPENGKAYHGFAVVMAQRGDPPAEAETYFRLAISKVRSEAAAHVDYARFLSLQGRFDESLDQGRQALKMQPTARNARAQIAYATLSKRDPVAACVWARQAKENGDDLEAGFLESVCQKPEK